MFYKKALLLRRAIALGLLSTLAMSCDSDPCEKKHASLGNCIPLEGDVASVLACQSVMTQVADQVVESLPTDAGTGGASGNPTERAYPAPEDVEKACASACLETYNLDDLKTEGLALDEYSFAICRDGLRGECVRACAAEVERRRADSATTRGQAYEDTGAGRL